MLSRVRRQDWVSPATFQLTSCRSRQAARWLRVTRPEGVAGGSWVAARVLRARVVGPGAAEVTSSAAAFLEDALVEDVEVRVWDLVWDRVVGLDGGADVECSTSASASNSAWAVVSSSGILQWVKDGSRAALERVTGPSPSSVETKLSASLISSSGA